MDREQKRHEGRLRVTLAGEYCFVGKEDWAPCWLNDLSADGLSLDGKISFYVGDKLRVRFVLDKRMILVKLEITHIHGKKAGGRITEIEEPDRRLIQEVLNRELMSGKTFFS
jgi:hypothetical protein